ncbi:helix-turn-helix domain-containing protein [Inquilinus limosus]|uniref:helix-turn-helix domain-containing protein n=1 Tax=Inquilinus limosus TaxID=171674 RepID=UPI000425DAEA|nr:helix-turn-helix domain-containing protein [Inquilinus limosus]
MRQSDDGPVLAKRAGLYREAPPALELAPHLLCRWMHAVPQGLALPVAVVPDGCVDLLWVGGRLVVAGPDLTAQHPLLLPGDPVVAVRFRPGAAFRWLGLPMSELTGRQVDLEDLRRPWARDLAGRIGEARTVTERMARLEAGLARIAPEIAPPAPEMALAFQLLGRGAEEAGLAALRDRLEISERSLRRRCHEAFGYGPKTLDRILRFQRFLTLAEAGEEGLSALAAAAGYADQAHLTREVRRLSGLTPAAILRQLALGETEGREAA